MRSATPIAIELALNRRTLDQRWLVNLAVGQVVSGSSDHPLV